jgi:hypothetical protein
MESNVKRKKWWLGYAFRGDEHHVNYTCGLYQWGVYQMFFSNFECLYFSIPKSYMFKL